MENPPSVRNIRRKTKSPARCRANTQEPAAMRSCRGVADDFLRHTFLPIWETRLPPRARVEEGFLRSVRNICALFDLEPPDLSAFSYPENIAKAHELIRPRLKHMDIGLEIVRKGRVTCLATAETFDTGRHLYYVPVKPVWLMTRRAVHQPMAELLLEMFRYLYQVADIPYFTEGGYLDYIYEILANWITEEIDDGSDHDWRESQLAELELLALAGEQILAKMKVPFDIQNLERAIASYDAAGIGFRNVSELAGRTLELATAFPGRSFASRLPEIDPEDYEDRVYMDNYLHFYWSGEDCLSESLVETVSSDLQERGRIEEPVFLQSFEEPQQKRERTFPFEEALLDLVSDLHDTLSSYEHEQNEQHEESD